MKKDDFYKILCTSTPEEINKFISLKGKKKMVNAITFLDDEYIKEREMVNIDEQQKR